MKKNSQGFLLTEAVIVITFVSLVLFFLFSQFNNIFAFYEKSFNYNSVDALYRTKEIKHFLLNTNFSELLAQLQTEELYVEFSDCEFSNNSNYCGAIMSELEVANAYFVNENLTGFQTYVSNTGDFPGLEPFLDYVDYDRNYEGFRLIIEFEDGQFASISFL